MNPQNLFIAFIIAAAVLYIVLYLRIEWKANRVSRDNCVATRRARDEYNSQRLRNRMYSEDVANVEKGLRNLRNM